ncbi:unnamed protein product, partial [Rotaria sp. Silwood1]
VRPRQPSPPPPLVICERTPRPSTPPPLILRERPPTPPPVMQCETSKKKKKIHIKQIR